MNLFIDKNHRRKSPIAIAGFFATLLRSEERRVGK